MKILWFSNAPWAPTGYGQQTAQVVRRLVGAGHEVTIAANFGLMAGSTTWEGVTVLPGGSDKYSADALAAHAEALGQDWIITLYDVWVLPELASRHRVASWAPVDHFPCPPEVAAHLKGHFPIAMTRYGQSELRDHGLNARYVPHAIESVFAPRESSFREAMGIPADAFLVMVNAANLGTHPPRKAWWEMLSGFKLFASQHSDTFLYLHTNPTSASGVNLPFLIAQLDIKDKVRVVPQYPYRYGSIPPEVLAEAYSASNVLLASSMGEGFGVPVIEAQACGIPVIVTDFASQPELVGAGWKVGHQAWYDPAQASMLTVPNIKSIAAALEEAYRAKGTMGDAARAFAAQYDADLVFDTYWRPVLAEMAAEVAPRPKRQRRKYKR